MGASISMLILLAPTLSLGQLLGSPKPEESVVRVFSTVRFPNPLRPWAKQNAIELSGTGVVLDEKTILTNAHVVAFATSVAIQGYLGGDRYDAKVVSLGSGIDLATLELEDPSFFKGVRPMPRAAGPPEPNSAVALLGFPVGGNGLAVTRGVVSRVDFAEYPGGVAGHRIQVDAAINPGSSGGPALVDNTMIGLTFGQLGMAENVGYVIPNQEIDAFLDDMKDGRYDGKFRLDDSFQSLENEGLRARLGLEKSVRGIMIREPRLDTPGYPLREYDVLTHIGQAAIDNEGQVNHEGTRLAFGALLTRLAEAGPVVAKVIRDGQSIEVELPLTREDDSLIKPYAGRYPRYFVHGPLVFSPVHEDAIPFYTRSNPLALYESPLVSRAGDRVKFPSEELVIVTSQMMSHKITKGYYDPYAFVIKEVDGVDVKNLGHLVELLRDGRGEFITLKFHGLLAQTMIFRRKALEDSTEEVMSDNGIARRGSEDVLKIWEHRPSDKAEAAPGPG